MNFRVNLAVALAAAFSFACADKPANIPELEAAMQAPEGMEVLGLYAMKVTPVEGSGGRTFSMQPIPVGRDGNPLTNPAGTIQVSGVFSAVTSTSPDACNGIPALRAPVAITNFSLDPLTNVWIDVLTVMGPTGTTACNSSLNTSGYFLDSERTDGLWSYPNLPPAPVADGSAGGASQLPTGGAWGFRYNSATPFQFYFRVVANQNAPTPTAGVIAGPNVPLTWISAVSNTTLFELCATNPGGQAHCAAPLVSQQVIGTGVAPNFSFSFAPTLPTEGATYYFRATNVYAAGTSLWHAPWVAFTYSSGLPVVAPTTVVANGAADPLYLAQATWTDLENFEFPQYTYAVLCQGPCPAVRVALDPAVLFDGPVSTFVMVNGLAEFALDVKALLAVDALTLTYWDPAVSYSLQVYPYDGISAAPAFAAAHSTSSVTVTPVAIAPTVTPPASWSALAPTWIASLAADAGFADVAIDVCAPDCILDPPDPGAGNSVQPPGGFLAPMTAGAGTFDFKTIPGLAALLAGQTFEYRVYNPDLYQVYPAAGTIVTVQ